VGAPDGIFQHDTVRLTMLIQGAFRHVNDSVTADDFLKFLSGEAPGGHYFVAQPPPGIVMTAAIHWRVIVPDSHCFASFASALWSGYESLVKPQQDDSKGRSPEIFIQIKNLKGECDQFTMGKDIQKRDGFVHRVKESVAVLSPRDKESALVLEIERTAGSDYWLKVC
jgi:hypothetical protein